MDARRVRREALTGGDCGGRSPVGQRSSDGGFRRGQTEEALQRHGHRDRLFRVAEKDDGRRYCRANAVARRPKTGRREWSAATFRRAVSRERRPATRRCPPRYRRRRGSKPSGWRFGSVQAHRALRPRRSPARPVAASIATRAADAAGNGRPAACRADRRPCRLAADGSPPTPPPTIPGSPTRSYENAWLLRRPPATPRSSSSGASGMFQPAVARGNGLDRARIRGLDGQRVLRRGR
jgi:hypothetical protein